MSRSARAIQRQAERDAERAGQQIARMFQRAARAADRSTRNLTHGGGGRRGGVRMPTGGRTRRAPGSASQYHLHVKKSRASGAGKSPVSSTAKIKYDLGLDEKDPHTDRVKIALMDAPDGTPHASRNPLVMAAACEERARQSKFANSHTGQMLHIDAALPNNLSADRLATLASNINKTISDQFKAPAYSGVHLDYGNFHIHSSVPLYRVHDDGHGGFYLGERIDHAKRPDERETLGLPRQPAGELRALRQKMADLIADSVKEELGDRPDREAAHHTSERWRHGHLTLSQQVEQAARRGDVEFVLDNINRDATKKEGPRPQSGSFTKSDPKREATKIYNAEAGKPSAVPGPELITRTLVNRVVDLAQKAEINTPESFRMFARDLGLNVHWSPSKEGGGVQGVTFSVAGGPRIAGQRAGASLGALQKKLGWAERPEYRRHAPRKGQEWDEYQKKTQAAGIKPSDSSDRAIKVTIDRLAKIEAQAQTVAQANAAPAASPAESGPEGPQKVQPLKQRPKRRSNDPSFNKRATTPAPGGRPASGRAAPAPTSHKVKTMTIDAKALMTSLSALPIDETTTAAVGAVGSAAAGAVRETMPSAIRPHTLSEQQKRLLLQAFDEREAARSGAFDGPLSITKERLDLLNRQISQHEGQEPEGGIYLKKRLFRTPIMAETDEHKKWREAQEKRRQHAGKLEDQISKMQKSAFNDSALLQALPGLEQEHADKLEQQRLEKLKLATSEYEKAIAQLNDAPFGFQRNQLFRTIKMATDAHPELAERERLRAFAVQKAAAPQQDDYEHDDAAERRRRNRSRER